MASTLNYNNRKLREFVVKTNQGEYFVLTRKEHQYLLSHQEDRFVHFEGVGTINPAQVDSIKEDPIEVLKDRFRCKVCGGGGIIMPEYTVCEPCEGTGVILDEVL